MADNSCNSILELLVEYTDGDLPADQSRRVADHLAGCPDCRAELRVLERSLELAREVWHESAAGAPTTTSPQWPERSLQKEWCATASSEAVPSHVPAEALLASKQWHTRRLIRAAACVAVCAVVLLLTAGPWLFSLRQRRQDVGGPAEVVQSVPQQPAEEMDIEALIAREGRSARLAAAARLLAAQPGLQEYARQAERYLQEAYRGTAAVNGALPPPPSHPNKEPES
jgi:hypothetical protein